MHIIATVRCLYRQYESNVCHLAEKKLSKELWSYTVLFSVLFKHLKDRDYSKSNNHTEIKGTISFHTLSFEILVDK